VKSSIVSRSLVTAGIAVLAMGLTACAEQKTGSGTFDPNTAKVAFLMPDEGSTRYTEHDRPGFEAQMAKLCPKCQVLYNNANADAAKQQQQFESAMTAGAKVIVLDAVDTSAAATLVAQAHSRGVSVIAYDRPIPTGKADFYVSFDNEKIGALIAQSLVDKLKADKVPTTQGVLQVNGSPTDAAAGLIKKGIHSALDPSGYRILAEFDTPDWEPTEAQNWVSGQISRFGSQLAGVAAANDGTGGGAIAAFKAAAAHVPVVTGNDATIAALQLIITGDQFNTINKPSEIVAAAAAEVAWKVLNGNTPTAGTTLFDTPAQLFVPALITRENIKAEIFDKGIAKASDVCTGTYAAACTALGISPS